MDILRKIKSILFNPEKFFSSLKEKTVQDSLLYFIILMGFNVIMSYFMFLLFGDVVTRMMYMMFNFNNPMPNVGSLFVLGQTIIAYILAVFFSFVIGGILYVWLLIFKGNKGYIRTYQLYIYSNTPSLLLKWIPFLGFLTWIYDFVLLIIGTKKIYNFSTTKAILIYLIPLALIFIFALIIMIFAVTTLGFLDQFRTF